MVNVALKCKALLAKSVVFITEGQYGAKWVYQARYFIGRALGYYTRWGTALLYDPDFVPSIASVTYSPRLC